ncbi:MAG TPA: DUF5985 family protein [Stellaceae bacterium]|nr:DUF5985 family protein [Stellaceae bacterium]
MTEAMNSALMGAVATTAFVAMLFFLRFWRQTRDSFFLLFAAAFGLDGVARFGLAVSQPSQETEPLYFLARLITFGLIIVAVIGKNRPARRPPRRR